MLIFNIVVSSQGLPGAQGDLPPVQSLYPDTRVAWIRVVGTTWTTGSEPSRFRGPRLSLCVIKLLQLVNEPCSHLESAQRTEIKPHLDIKSNGAHDNGSPPLSLPPSTLALLPRGKRAPVV